MNNDELKKKIISALQSVEFVTEKGWCGQCISLRLDYSAIADALIAAGIGDVEQQHDIFKKTYMNFFERINRDNEFRKKFDTVTLGCQIGMFEDILDKAEKELAEENGGKKKV